MPTKAWKKKLKIKATPEKHIHHHLMLVCRAGVQHKTSAIVATSLHVMLVVHSTVLTWAGAGRQAGWPALHPTPG